MRALTLFKPTFQRLQKTLEQGELITNKVLPKTFGARGFESLDQIFFNLNCLQYAATDLQSPEVDQQLLYFQQFLDFRKMTVSYDYKLKGFKLVSQESINDKISKLAINLRSIRVQNIDHPVLRGTLYFHELKDMQKLVKIKYPPNAPKFIKDLIRKNTQNQLLDSSNPLGVPIKAPALQFILEFNEKFAIEMYCRFGNVNIKTVRLLKKDLNQRGQPTLKCDYLIDGMNIPRLVQKVVYDVCQQEIGLGQAQLYHLHKVAYIGGRVEEIESMLDLQEFFTHTLEYQ